MEIRAMMNGPEKKCGLDRIRFDFGKDERDLAEGVADRICVEFGIIPDFTENADGSSAVVAKIDDEDLKFLNAFYEDEVVEKLRENFVECGYASVKFTPYSELAD